MWQCVDSLWSRNEHGQRHKQGTNSHSREGNTTHHLNPLLHIQTLIYSLAPQNSPSSSFLLPQKEQTVCSFCLT